jgi:hypothetical protein
VTCPHAGPHSPSNMTVNHTPLQFRTLRDTVNQAPALSAVYSQSVVLRSAPSKRTLLAYKQEVDGSIPSPPTTQKCPPGSAKLTGRFRRASIEKGAGRGSRMTK